MIFNSYLFLFGFLPVVLAGTFLLARIGAGVAQIWIILASLVFYAAWNAAYLPLLLGSIVCNHAVGAGMIRTGSPAQRTWMLRGAVAGNLLLLGYYKYTGFFLDNLNAVTGADFSWPALILPLGISFYTFQQLTLLADIAAGRVEECRFRDFLLFVVFFPHLIAGPIVHHRDMMPQFETADYRPRLENIVVGLVLLTIGLFKKAVLADGWIAQATTKQADIGAPGRGYGFQWWTYDDGSFAAQGIFGQSIYIDPKRRLVIATSGNWPTATDRKVLQPAREAFFKAVRNALGAPGS